MNVYKCSVKYTIIPNTDHKAVDTANTMLKRKNDLDIMNCYGQSYDNASNMSGIYS